MTVTLGLTLADLDVIEAALAAAEQANDVEAVAALVAELERILAWTPEPHQVPPPTDWGVWALVAGRGTGKTDTGASYMDAHMCGPPCDPRVPGGHRGRIIAPTFGDAVAACVNGPAGIRAHNEAVRLVGTKEGTLVKWPNGAEARVFGAHTPGDVDRLRAGTNACIDWFDELAAMRYGPDAWDQAAFGRRLGSDPRAVVTTTPRNLDIVRRLVASGQAFGVLAWLARLGFVDPPAARRSQRVALSTATTADNPHLDAEIRADLYAAYGGTRLGQQELEGQILDDIGTVFSRSWFGYLDGHATGPVTVRYWDLAATEDTGANDPDWTAGVRVTVTPDAGQPIVLADGSVARTHAWNVDDVVRVRASAARVAETVLQTARADGPKVPVWIEQDPAQAGKDQVERYKTLLAGITKVDGNLPTGPKLTRATVVSVPAEQRNVTLTRAGWNRAYLDELEAFDGDKNGGQHDDQVDATSGAFAMALAEIARRKRNPIVSPGGGTKPSGRI